MSKIKILIPVYNDWQSVFKLLENINAEVSTLNYEFSVMIVNDASTESRPKFLFNLDNLKEIQIINMKKNKGHARCNAAGLKYFCEKENFDYIIPMDADGEDRPEELELLIGRLKDFPNSVITANRIKRHEGPIFKFCYISHKYLTYIFTGQSIGFGNYTCLPKSVVNEMIKEPATWSSFSGSLTKITKDRKFISSERGKRYFGPSKMSFFNLLKHSLSIISVFRKTVLVRSALFIIIYILMIKSNASIITAIPLIFLLIMIYSISTLALRENMDEFDKALSMINDEEKMK